MREGGREGGREETEKLEYEAKAHTKPFICPCIHYIHTKLHRRAVNGVLDTTFRIQPTRITNGPVTFSTRTYEVGREEGGEGA